MTLTKPYGLQFGHKHYNQLLSKNKLLSPRLKNTPATFHVYNYGYLQQYNHFNAMSNNFVMSDIMNTHIPRVPFEDPLASLDQNPLCESPGIFHSLHHRFRNPKPNAGNQIINQFAAMSKESKGLQLGWKNQCRDRKCTDFCMKVKIKI